MNGLDENFWDDLLGQIEEGKVIPIVGAGVVTRGDDEQLFYPWLARRLAERLGLDPARIPAPGDLNSVATTHLLNHGPSNRIYMRISDIIQEECPPPGKPLRDLASISNFNFFISTTFDPLLQMALDTVRYGGAQQTSVYTFSPLKQNSDLPERRQKMPGTNILHLLGRVSRSPDYVVWEDDMLEFILTLNQQVPELTRLKLDLKEHWLLIVGLNYSDWLVRFFLRAAKQNKFSALDIREGGAYYADARVENVPESLVLFFGALTQLIHVVRWDPIAFCDELGRRWRERHPEGPAVAPARLPIPPAEMPFGAIFISYAREDEAAAAALVRGLAGSECVVWYDRERLTAGRNWRNDLEIEVKKRCGLFISVISSTTEHSREGYYHAERHWAAERAEGIAHDEEFYIPVIIDDTPDETTKEPPSFKLVHATRLPQGETTPAFSRHLFELQRRILASPP